MGRGRIQSTGVWGGGAVTGWFGIPMVLCGAFGLGLVCAGCGTEVNDAAPAQAVEVMPVENTGPMAVRIRELWRRELDDGVEIRGGMEVWDDGTVWFGGNGPDIWEMDARGEALRPREYEAYHSPGYALALAATPSRQSVLLVSRNGATLYPGREEAGVFTAMNRNSIAGIAAFEGGDFVLSYGQYPNDPQVEYALHRYSRDGDHVASWHAAFPHSDWSVVTFMTGGPVAVTREGDLLLAERAPPFRIVRYPGAHPGAAVVVIEDETIVSPEEIRRALPRGGKGVQWNRPVFVDQVSGGNILTVVRYYPRRQRAAQGLWVVVSPEGDVLAKSRFREDYRMITATGTDGRYLAYVRGGNVVALDVTMGTIGRSAH